MMKLINKNHLLSSLKIAAMYRSLRNTAMDVSEEGIAFRIASGEVLYVYRFPRRLPDDVEQPAISFSVSIELQHALNAIPSVVVPIEARNKHLILFYEGLKLKINRIPSYFVDISEDPFANPKYVVKDGDDLPF